MAQFEAEFRDAFVSRGRVVTGYLFGQGSITHGTSKDATFGWFFPPFRSFNTYQESNLISVLVVPNQACVLQVRDVCVVERTVYALHFFGGDLGEWHFLLPDSDFVGHIGQGYRVIVLPKAVENVSPTMCTYSRDCIVVLSDLVTCPHTIQAGIVGQEVACCIDYVF